MKRFLFLLGFIPVFSIWIVISWFFLFLDFILFPGFVKVKVKKPVFITGLTRTGSTLLYNAMHMDQKFTSMKLWEILFAPSITQRKLTYFFARPKPVYRILTKKIIPLLEKNIFGEIDDIHPSSFLEIEEDEFVFYQIFASGSLFFHFPRMRFFLKYSRFDISFGSSQRKLSMLFYKQIIQRHLYFHGKEKIYLSKSPPNTSRIRSIKHMFPDSKIIYLLRDPMKSIPSTFSMFSAIRQSNFVPITDKEEFLNDGLEMADHWFRHPLNIIKESDRSSILVIHSNDLFSNTISTIRTIYKNIDISFPENYEYKLNRYNTKKHKSGHDYSLDEFGLTKEMIERRFRPLYNELLKEKCEIDF